MDYSGILRRIEIERLKEYIMSGDLRIEEPSQQSYIERLMEADEKAHQFFKARYPDMKEYDEIMAYYYNQTGVIKEVYFEIGVIAGGKIAFEISKKMEELK